MMMKKYLGETLWRVPEAAVLGLLIFSVYIDHISIRLKYCRLYLYTDDLQMYLHFKVNVIDSAVENMT